MIKKENANIWPVNNVAGGDSPESAEASFKKTLYIRIIQRAMKWRCYFVSLWVYTRYVAHFVQVFIQVDGSK